MAQISKYPVSKKVEERMFELLHKAISNLKDTGDIENFLSEFLSPVEKIVLAKRFSIAVLLEKGLDYDTIAEKLRVTPITISKVSLQRKFAGNGYKKVIEKILQQESVMEFWEKIDDAFAKIPDAKGSNMIEKAKKHAQEKWLKQKTF